MNRAEEFVHLPLLLSNWIRRRSVVVLPANIGPTITWISPNGGSDTSICKFPFWAEQTKFLDKGVDFKWRWLGIRIGFLGMKDSDVHETTVKGVVLALGLGRWGPKAESFGCRRAFILEMAIMYSGIEKTVRKGIRGLRVLPVTLWT